MSMVTTCECGQEFEAAEADGNQPGGCPLCSRRALGELEPSGERLRGKGTAKAGIVLGVIAGLVTLACLVPAFLSAREAARRSQCVNNLKQIGLAIQNFYQTNGSLPSAAITDRNGKPLLSWRVAILPYLECGPMYLRFHLDEPWDSPHNLSLLDPTPYVYRCPSDTTLQPGMTAYQAVIGPSTAFTPDFTPLQFADFLDGTDNTLLVGESRRGVPWTKPEDLLLDMTVPLAGLGSHHDNGFHVLFVGGSVRFVKSSIGPSILGAILTRKGGEVVGCD